VVKKIALLLLISVLLILIGCTPTKAASDFYEANLAYESYHQMHLKGHIASIYIEADKPGIACIGQQVEIPTAYGIMTVDIRSIHYGDDRNYIEVIVRQADGNYITDYIKMIVGEIYSYELMVVDGCVWVDIVTFDHRPACLYHEPCKARYIKSVTTYTKYWRSNQEGSFFYYGFITVSNPHKLQKHDYFYHKFVYPFAIYSIHHNWSGITDKGEIDDRNV